MKEKRSRFTDFLPKAISAFLAFWLSSVLVLVCCNSHLWKVSASNNEQTICPLAKGHDCCKKTKDRKSFSQQEEKNADCCAFKPQKTLSFDLKTQQEIKQLSLFTEKLKVPSILFFAKQNYKLPSVFHSAIRNRGSTYLKNCIFRI